MRFYCQTVDLAYLDSALYRIENQVIVNASPGQVFKVFEDENSWPEWVEAINKVEWTSPKPFGVGTTRTVILKAVTADEKFIAWDPGKRFTFYFTATSVPFAHKFCEDYQLEPVDKGKTKLTHVVAFQPCFLLKAVGPILKRNMATIFLKALQSLANTAENIRQEV